MYEAISLKHHFRIGVNL